jgi:TonB-linked SusC/RagA family outer membrane protein
MFKCNAYSAVIVASLIAVLTIPLGQSYAQEKTKPAVLSDTTKKNIPSAEDEVNIGYLSLKRKYIAPTIATIPALRFSDLSRISPDALLQGQVAGVQVVNSSGAAGAGTLVNIRGTASINGLNNPLYLIDGIPVKTSRVVNPLSQNSDNNPLADINPNDIESITILKDGQSTAKYGMRGANGVVLINTFGGTTGKTVLNFAASTGISPAPGSASVFNADDYRGYIIEKESLRGLTSAQINNGIGRYLLLSTPDAQRERYNNDTDWQNLVKKGGVYNDYHFMLRGGDAIARYSLSVGYTGQEGNIVNTDFNRLSTRFNIDYKVGRKLTFANSLSYSQTNKSLTEEGNAYLTNPLYVASLKSPVLTSFQQDREGINLRELDSADYTGRSNPYSIVNRMRNENSTNRISGRVVGQYTFSPALSLKIGLFADYYRLNEKRFRPAAGFAPEENRIRESSTQNSVELMALNENVLNYSKTFGDHFISALVGTTIQTSTLDSKYGVFINGTSDQLTVPSTTDQRFIDTLTSNSPQWNLMSVFTNAQYAYKGKYLVGATLRSDGSSTLEKGKRWGTFPGVSLGWLVSSESFLENSNLISNLKLKTSYGLSGNLVGYYNAFNAITPTPYFNYPAVRLGALGNKDFTWEHTSLLDAGFDLGLFNNKLSISADVYYKNTKNLYHRIDLPGTSGFKNYPVSEGEVNNTGVELGISGSLIKRKFSWQTSFNITYNKNEIIALPALLRNVINYGDFSGISQIGSASGAFYGYNATGVYRTSADVVLKNGADNLNPFQGGDIIFEDLDGNGIIDEKDQKTIGKSTPDFFGGFTNIFAFGKFDLSVFVDFAVGQEIYNGQRAALEAMSNYDNQSVSINDRWKKDGDVTEMPRLLHGDAVGNNRFSSRWMENGSFVRFRSVSLGYNLPVSKFLKGVFKSARIVVTGQNLYTFSDSEMGSAEVANVNNPLMYGQNYGSLPQVRSYLAGIKLGL